MDIWNYLEYAAWILSVVFGISILVNWYKIDTTYSEDVLTSSQEGELEAMTEQHKI